HARQPNPVKHSNRSLDQSNHSPRTAALATRRGRFVSFKSFSGTPRHLGVNPAPGESLACCGCPPTAVRSLQAIGAEAGHKRRDPGLSARAGCRVVLVSRGSVPGVVACRSPVLVVERGVCERGSPAGHGGPAEWAWTAPRRSAQLSTLQLRFRNRRLAGDSRL